MYGYDHQAIEQKWQARWADERVHRTPNPGDDDFDPARPKMYVLDMFPYPSGEGLHVGHAVGYIGTDIFSRYKRMRGYAVLHPMGFDSFGLPAEQYAVETGVHPRLTSQRNESNYVRQLTSFALSYDWERCFSTTDPDYYRWTQWIFLRLFDSWFDPDAGKARPIAELVAALEADDRDADGQPWSEFDEGARRRYLDDRRLAYIDEVMVNWCPGLGTVLANEEVTRDGRSDRGNFPVYRRPLRQWMLRITAYADRLVEDLALLDWPESVKTMQTNWIGRSEGARIWFPVEDSGSAVEVFTTRHDTVFGATYMVLAPEHPMVDELTVDTWPTGTPERWTGGHATPIEAVEGYRTRAEATPDRDRLADQREKTGVFTGSYCINPATGERIPVFIADYVLMGYGTGAIMAVPGQDERDWEFARLFDLAIVRTVQPPDDFDGDAYLGDGPAINSGFLDGLGVEEAKAETARWLVSEGHGEPAVSYKLRDWLFSRQRYWGEPIPILHGPDGELRPLADEDLPLTLPEIDDFRPSASDEEDADPVPALARVPEAWRVVEIDGVRYERELNTMPQWAGSCWYYLRFADPHNAERFVGEDAERYWMGETGVDLYVGGVEHGVLHLLYVRFWHKLLFDLGYVSTVEPFRRLFNQGIIQADAFMDERGMWVPAEKVELGDGVYLYEGREVTRVEGRMGKSKKNSVSPDEFFYVYGIDTLRLYEMFMGPLDQAKPWTTRDIVGVTRFLQRVWRNFIDADTGELLVVDAEPDDGLARSMHRTIRAVTEDMEHLRFNTAIARLFELNNELVALDRVPRTVAEAFVLLLSPIAPHVAEELWERLGHDGSILAASWPTFDPDLAMDETVTLVVQVNGKVRDRIEVDAGIDEDEATRLALASEKVAAALGGAEPSRVIARPPKLVNVVVA
ncbi:MAG: leucine--tRNA ligase [Acidimicrobiia bacterium]